MIDPKSMNQQGFLNLPLILILSTVILISVGFYFASTGKFTKPIPSPTPTSTSSPQPSTQLLESHYKGVDCANLIGEAIRPNNDILESKKQICASERAWFENNPDFCKLHSDPDHCYRWMAIKLKDMNLCKQPGIKTQECIKLLETTQNEDTWQWDYIRKNQNPI